MKRLCSDASTPRRLAQDCYGSRLEFTTHCHQPLEQTRQHTWRGDSLLKKHAIVTGILALAAPLAMAQTSTWNIDSAHSEVDFTVRRLVFTDVQGRFGRVTGELDLNEAEVTKSTVRMTIDLAGIDTKDDIRDEHLRSNEFFEVAAFPTAKFVSTSVTSHGSSLTVTGDLTLHGFTRPVTVNVDAPRHSKGADKKLHTSYQATTTIARTAFAVGNAYPDVAISDDVKLTISLETVKK
jgi:polyisoprenoid-binding protein YceI